MWRWVALALSLGLWASVCGAQGTARDSAIERRLRIARDSISCVTSQVAGARCVRARQRIDSLRLALVCPRPILPGTTVGTWFCPSTSPPSQAPVASVAVGFPGPVFSPLYMSGNPWAAVPGVDTVTVCPVIVWGDSTSVDSAKVAWPPARVRTIGDSAFAVTRGGNALDQMCGPTVSVFPNAVIGDSVTAPKATWRLVWLSVNGRRILRPVFQSP